jgi:hypothetical protein
LRACGCVCVTRRKGTHLVFSVHLCGVGKFGGKRSGCCGSCARSCGLLRVCRGQFSFTLLLYRTSKSCFDKKWKGEKIPSLL